MIDKTNGENKPIKIILSNYQFHEEKEITNIIYYYDKKIKTYCFCLQDDDKNILKCEYTSRNGLKGMKKYLYEIYGLNSIKD